jgi:hypothetical protein
LTNELLPSESPAVCVAFLRRAAAWYRERGIAVERVLSDNGNGHRPHSSLGGRSPISRVHKVPRQDT